MSIICKNFHGWVIDHSKIIDTIYQGVQNNSMHSEIGISFKLLPRDRCTYNENMFKIATPYLYDSEAKNINHLGTKCKSNKKRKNCSGALSINDISEVSIIKSTLEKLLESSKQSGYFVEVQSNEDYIKNNKEARDFSSLFFNDVCKVKLDSCNGGNTSCVPIFVNIHGQDYLIPNNSKFFCCDIQCLQLPDDSKFDFVLIDPPWWNKYVRRRKIKQKTGGYKMMYNDDVATIPISRWLARDALVAVWCTNCVQHAQDVITKWFPVWGLYHVATWYWIKVTRSGEPVCRFSPPPGKQPYERILFGAPQGRSVDLPPDNKCIVSVPSAIHSHKPPLIEVMKPYLPTNPQCLELFARYLLPHWTSVGDQVLSLQNKKLFTQIQKTETYYTLCQFLFILPAYKSSVSGTVCSISASPLDERRGPSPITPEQKVVYANTKD